MYYIVWHRCGTQYSILHFEASLFCSESASVVNFELKKKQIFMSDQTDNNDNDEASQLVFPLGRLRLNIILCTSSNTKENSNLS